MSGATWLIPDPVTVMVRMAAGYRRPRVVRTSARSATATGCSSTTSTSAPAAPSAFLRVPVEPPLLREEAEHADRLNQPDDDGQQADDADSHADAGQPAHYRCVEPLALAPGSLADAARRLVLPT